MTRAVLMLVALAASGCSQAFRFTDDAGSSDAGCALPGECECVVDGNCTGARSRCAADRRCVECLVNADCGANGLCDAKTRRCTTSCTADSQCNVDTRTDCRDDAPRYCRACDDPPSCSGATPNCAESVGYCVQCNSDSHCAAPTPRCDRRSGTCVTCLTASHCAATEYCAVATGTCALRP